MLGFQTHKRSIVLANLSIPANDNQDELSHLCLCPLRFLCAVQVLLHIILDYSFIQKVLYNIEYFESCFVLEVISVSIVSLCNVRTILLYCFETFRPNILSFLVPFCFVPVLLLILLFSGNNNSVSHKMMNDDATTTSTPKAQVVQDSTIYMLRDPPPLLRRCSESSDSSSGNSNSNSSNSNSDDDEYYYQQESSSRKRVYKDYDPSVVIFPILPSRSSRKKLSVSSSSVSAINIDSDAAPPVRTLFGNITINSNTKREQVAAAKSVALPVLCTLPPPPPQKKRSTTMMRTENGHTDANNARKHPHLCAGIPADIRLVPRRREQRHTMPPPCRFL